MADISPRMQWPFPAENEDPWVEAFQDFVRASDASAYAAREDRNLILMGGGVVTWNGTTGVLTWTAAIEFLSPGTGFLNQVPAGTLTLADSQVIRGNLARGLGANASMAVAAAGFALSNDNSVLLAVRRGTQLYWRNGLLMANGDVVTNLGSTQGAGAVTLAGDVTGPSGTNVVARIRGATVQNVAPVNGQILIYKGAPDNRWEPTTPAAPFTAHTGLVGRLVRTSAGVYKRIQDNLLAGTAPTGSNNNLQGYEAGSIWVDQSLAPNNHVYIAAGEDGGAMVWLEVGAGAGGNVFVFRPGGVEADNVYTTWASFYTAISAIEGPKVARIDSSLGVAQVAAGVWDFHDWTIVGDINPTTGGRPLLTILTGAAISGNFRAERVTVRMDSGASVPIVYAGSSTRVIELVDADLDGGVGAGGVFSVAASGPGIRLVMRGTSRIFSLAAVITGGNFSVDLYDRSQVDGDAFGGGGGVLTIRIMDPDTASYALQPSYGVANVTSPKSVWNGPINEQQLGTTELHVGSVYLDISSGPLRLHASTHAMIGGSIVSETGILRIREFVGGALVASITRAGTLDDQALNGGVDIDLVTGGWYDLFLVAGGAAQTALIKGLQLVVVRG